MSIEVVRGNCPCSLRLARELETEPVALDCQADPDGSCEVEDLLGEFAANDRTPAAEANGAEGKVTLDPGDLAPLYAGDFGDLFLLVTSPRIRETLRVENRRELRLEEFTWLGPDSRADVIATLRDVTAAGQRCSVLWIAEDEFEHYLEEDLESAKLAAVSFFSNPYSPGSLDRYLRLLGATDYDRELEIEARLLDLLENGRRVVFRSPRFGTSAVFEHHASEHWFSLHGALHFGQQTVLPTGELATLTDESGQFTTETPFEVNGEIVLKGQPIVHRGNRGVTPDETESMFDALAHMQKHAVILRVDRGFVHEVVSPTSGLNPLHVVIDAILKADDRYRKIHEIGFGTNPLCARMAPTNFFANERWPGVHCGFGLGGYTPFHLDLACTELDVLVERTNGETVDVYRELALPRHREVAGH